MNEPQTDAVFEDGETYGSSLNKQEVSFRSIPMETLKSVRSLASVEMRGGYDTERVVGNVVVETYIPDSREIYCNAIDYLSDILFPHFDQQMFKAEQDIDAEIKKLEERSSKDNKVDVRAGKVLLKRKLFRHLNSFLFRKNYFVAGGKEE